MVAVQCKTVYCVTRSHTTLSRVCVSGVSSVVQLYIDTWIIWWVRLSTWHIHYGLEKQIFFYFLNIILDIFLFSKYYIYIFIL